jgi:hypothetical protein
MSSISNSWKRGKSAIGNDDKAVRVEKKVEENVIISWALGERCTKQSAQTAWYGGSGHISTHKNK